MRIEPISFWLGVAAPFAFAALVIFLIWVLVGSFAKSPVGRGECDHCIAAGLSSTTFEPGDKTYLQVWLADRNHTVRARLNTAHRRSWQNWWDSLSSKERARNLARWPKADSKYGLVR